MFFFSEIKEEPEIIKDVNLNNTEEIFLRGLLESPKHHRAKVKFLTVRIIFVYFFILRF